MRRSRRKAPVWQHFKRLENDTNRAKCNYCPTTVSCQQGTTSNMCSHLRSKHVGKYVTLGSNSGGEGEDDNDVDDVGGEEVSGVTAGVTSPSSTPTPSPSPSPSGSRPAGTAAFSFSPPPVSPSAPSASTSRAPSRAATPTRQSSLDSYRCDNKTTERLHYAVTYYIVTCNRPLNTVEKDGFKAMLQAFKPGYKVLSRRSLTDVYIPECVEDVRACIKLLLKDAEVFALTSDNWTSAADVPFTSLTAHFFDKAWDNLYAVTLCCRATHAAHTGINLKDFFTDEVKSWDIDKVQCTALTSDNAAEMRSAAELFGIPHMRCIGHTVQNGVTNILELPYVKPVIKEAKALLTWVSTTRVWNAYVAWAERVHGAIPLMLPSVSPTRWWSELKLLEQIIKSHDHLREFSASYARGKHLSIIPGEQTMYIIRALVRALKPLEEICTNLSADTYVTASAVLPVLHLLEAGFDEDDEPLSGALTPEFEEGDEWANISEEDFKPAALRAFVLKKLKKRYCPEPLNEENLRGLTPQLRGQALIDFKCAEACHSLLVKCSFLDPRYKEELSHDEREEAKKLLAEEFSQFHQTVGAFPSNEQHEQNLSKKKSLQSLFSKKKRAIEGENQGGAAAAVPSSITPENAFQEELARFSNIPAVDMDVDIRLWWKERIDAYPKLQFFARKYLAIPASSTTSERLFSDGGNVITDTRHCLTDNHSQQLIFLSSNRKYLKKPS